METIIDVLQQNILAALVLVPIVTALVSGLKNFLPEKYAFLYSIGVGVGLVVILLGFSGINIIVGIALGLAASGLWSGVVKPVRAAIA